MRHILIILILALSGTSVSARKLTSCEERLYGEIRLAEAIQKAPKVEDTRPALSKEEVAKITAVLRQPHLPGHHGVRIITDEPEETPDPDRPLKFTLPNGAVKYMIGFSGQKAMYVDDVREIFQGGIKKTQPIHLFNQNGIQYGVEIDPDGKKIHYAYNSSLWDIYAVPFKSPATGEMTIKIFAGGMGNYSEGEKAGHPMVVRDGSQTRQRLFFDGKFQQQPEYEDNGMGGYVLTGINPIAPLNRLTPQPGKWILKDRHGTGFQHGYGGGPVTLANGDLYTTKEGWVAFIHESVIQQKIIRFPNGTKVTMPYLTVQSVTYLDPTLTTVMAPARTIWSPVRPDGTVYQAAIRHSLQGSPLTEGLHINPMVDGRPIESAEELARLRAEGKEIVMDGMHSHGEYYAEYGGSGIKFKEDFSDPRPIVDEFGEIEDFLKVLSPIFTWRGRPVSTFIDGQEYVMAHAVDRANIPEGVPMNVMPASENWVHFNRQIIAFPIERYMLNGSEHIRIKDNTGLLEYLARYQAAQIW